MRLASLLLLLAFVLTGTALGQVSFVEDLGVSLPGLGGSAAAWGDYDDDGDLDLALTGSFTARIYVNDGSGGLTDLGAGLVGVDFGAVAWGDYDDDGDLDLVLAGCTVSGCGSATTRIYQNNGGTFTDLGAPLPGVGRSAVQWGDIDDDGDLDLLLAGSFTSALYRNDGGTFVNHGTALPGVDAAAVDFGDYDDDGDLDFALAGDTGAGLITKVYANDGSAAFSEAASLPGLDFGGLDFADFDDDGDLDLLAAGNGFASIFRNDGGSFVNHGTALPGLERASAMWGDADGDGDEDVLLTGSIDGTFGGNRTLLYLNDGGSFTDALAGFPGVDFGTAVWGDYDGDGDEDVLLSGRDATPALLTKLFENTTSPPPPPNQPPVADDDAYSLDEDATLTVSAPGVLDNDDDPDGDPITASLLADVSDGTLVLNADGGFVYTPDPGFFGTDSFTYVAHDGALDSAPATVTLTVSAVNQPPVADDDAYSLDEDATLTVAAPGVLGNDDDPDGDPITASLLADVSDGTLVLNADGGFTYTPTGGFSGTDTFTYVTNDGALDSAPATVTLTVNAVNQPPVADDDAYSLDEDATLTVPAPGVLGNDDDPDGDPITAALLADVSNGTLALNADGGFTYTPDGGFFGTDSFTYVAHDGALDSAPATVTLTVSAVNQPPVASNDGFGVLEGASLTVSAPGVLGNDDDPDGDPITAALLADVSNGTLALGSDGGFTYTPDGGFFGTDSFTYVANDGVLDSAPATVTLTVHEDLPPPPTTSIRFATIGDYGDDFSNAVAVADLTKALAPDVILTLGDNNYPLGAAATIDQNIGQQYHDFIYPYLGTYGPGAAYNRFFPALGNHDYDTPGAQPYLDYFTLPGNEQYYDFVRGPVHFFAIDSNFQQPDGTDATSAQAAWLEAALAASTADWQVVYFHHAPHTSADRGPTTYMRWPFKTWGADLVLAAHNHVYERLEIDGLTYIVNGLGGRTIHAFGPTPDPNSLVRYNTDYGTQLITATDCTLSLEFYAITGGGTLIDSHTLDQCAGGVPMAVNDAYSLDEGTTLAIAAPGVLGNDTDGDGDPLAATLDADVMHGTLALGSDGGFTYTPDGGFFGMDMFAYTASDGTNTSNTATVMLTVRPDPGTGPALCYVVADNDGTILDDILTVVDRATGIETLVGPTGTFLIEAMAIDPATGTLYATDGKHLGTLDPATGTFTAIGKAGNGDGALGLMAFDDIDGLAFESGTGHLYGSVRTAGDDLLIRLNPATGGAVGGVFGAGADYLVIAPLLGLDDIDDLAFDPTTGTLLAIINEDDGMSRLIEIDMSTGQTTDRTDLDVENVEGLAFDGDGVLLGSLGSSGQALVAIDPATGVTTSVATLGLNAYRDYEALDCVGTGSPPPPPPDPNTISGAVFEDVNNDGVFNLGDLPAVAFPVELFRDDNANGAIDLGEPLLGTFDTDDDGLFMISITETGTFALRPDPAAVPVDAVFTTPAVHAAFFDGFGQTDADNGFGYHIPPPPPPPDPLIDLELTKIADDDTPEVGGPVVFTLTLTNNAATADADATGIRVDDALPPSLTFVSAAPAPGTTFDDNALTWTVPSLALGGSVVLTLTATVETEEAVENCAWVAAANEDDADSTPGPASQAGEDDEDCAALTPVAPPPPPPMSPYCFAVADNDGIGDSEDVLTMFTKADGIETVVGAVGTMLIEAIAFSPFDGLLYAADGKHLGTLDLATGVFSEIGKVGNGTGPLGFVSFDDVDGLSFDPNTGHLYGSVRESGDDLLIRINPVTGGAVGGAFGGGADDYLVIETLAGLDDIDDIAIDPVDSRVYAIQNEDDGGSRLVMIDKLTGLVTDLTPLDEDNIEGLSFDGDGTLLGVLGSSGKAAVTIDKTNGTTTRAATLGTDGHRDYEAVDCLTNAVNQMAVTVFEDADGDGVFGTTDVGKPGVPMELYRDVNADGLLDGGDILLGVLATDADGVFGFAAASSGAFVLKVAPAEPMAMTQETVAVSFEGFGHRAEDAHVGLRPLTATATEADELPTTVTLEANYPNPFNPTTTLAFSLPAPADVRLTVFDLLGRTVAVLADGPFDAGRHTVAFDAGTLPSGVYLYRLDTAHGTHVRTMLLLK